ncbi:MAG: hypothetical protein JW712_09490 [Dehalococcoidales bacterium]|nr:hypothetical protein [Dehalococcoidales bacterium]
MLRKKKFIIGLLITVLVVAASLGGIAYAQGEDEDSQSDSLMSKVAAILGIDRQTVEDAFEQAQAEIKQEHQDALLQKLVDEGILTEEQAAEYKDWLESRPDMGEYRTRMKEWLESMPDLPENFEGKGFGIFRGKFDNGGMRGFDGQWLPVR